MQATSLTPAQLDAVQEALSVHVRDRGDRILGAQLGLIISQAAYPVTMRELGGLRAIVERDLNGSVQALVKDPQSKDTLFSVRLKANAQFPLPLNSEETREVAGPDLWRYFSNPKLLCGLHANRAGTIVVSPPVAALKSEFMLVEKPSAEDYRNLAQEFARNQSTAVRFRLQKVFEQYPSTEYYNAWIDALRELRSSVDKGILRNWETVRSEYVAQRLFEALLKCSIDEAKVSEIVASARPGLKARSPSKLVSEQRLSPASATPQADTIEAIAQSDEITSLRALIHRAIDLMSSSELREIRIPAGLLNDVARQIHR